jgi:hypothetical protein
VRQCREFELAVSINPILGDVLPVRKTRGVRALEEEHVAENPYR